MRKTSYFLALWLMLRIHPSLSDPVNSLVNFDIFQTTSSNDVCPILADPENGKFKCIKDKPRRGEIEGNVTCYLRCNPGYVLPLKHHDPEKVVALDDIGLYHCNHTKGRRRTWKPVEFFDCIPAIDPLHCGWYFPVKLTAQSCDNGSRDAYRENALTNAGDSKKSLATNFCNIKEGECWWELYVHCNGTEWKLGVFFYYRWNKENFIDLRNMAKESVPADLNNTWFRVPTQVGPMPPKFSGTWFIDCPTGTRFSTDYSCHGCTRGSFMNETNNLCQHCPKGSYSDKHSQVACVSCPKGSPGTVDGGIHIISCFNLLDLVNETDFLTISGFLTTVVIVASAVLACRTQFEQEFQSELQDADGKKKKNKVDPEEGNETEGMWFESSSISGGSEPEQYGGQTEQFEIVDEDIPKGSHNGHMDEDSNVDIAEGGLEKRDSHLKEGLEKRDSHLSGGSHYPSSTRNSMYTRDSHLSGGSRHQNSK